MATNLGIVTGTILAMGGLGSHSARLFKHFAGLTGRLRPRICLLPTAAADSPDSTLLFYEHCRDCGAIPSHLNLFKRQVADPRSFLLGQDAIFVGGGNTASMLAVWRAHGIDSILREAWEAGVVLGGPSAGANCWFEASVTDSFGPKLAALNDGLGFIPGSFCPHFDSEAERRPVYTALVAEGFPAGFAADDGAALRFSGRNLEEAVSASPEARAYRIDQEGENPLERIRLLD